MLIWRGFGWAVAGLVVVVVLATEVGTEAAFGDEAYYQLHGWPKLFALTLAAGLVWLLAHHLDKQPGRIVIDKETGQEIALVPKHDLFFVPLRYWPAILVVGGIAVMFVG